MVNSKNSGQADGRMLQGLELLRVLPGHFDKQPTHALGHETHVAQFRFHTGFGTLPHRDTHIKAQKQRGEQKLPFFVRDNSDLALRSPGRLDQVCIERRRHLLEAGVTIEGRVEDALHGRHHYREHQDIED